MDPCKKVVLLIAASRTRDLSADEARFLKEHSAACRECAEHLTATEVVAGLLPRTLPREVPAPAGFNDRLRERLVENGRRPRWYSYLPSVRFRPLELAFVAFFVLFAAAVTIYFSVREDTAEPRLITERMVPADTPLSIDLEYLATRRIPSVVVTVELSEGVSFHSVYPEIADARSHQWKGGFDEGMNTVPFMVTVTKPGVWEIRTRADFEGWRHEHLIMITSTGRSVTMAMYRLPKRRIP